MFIYKFPNAEFNAVMLQMYIFGLGHSCTALLVFGSKLLKDIFRTHRKDHYGI